MMIVTYALIVGPSAYYFYSTFWKAWLFEKALALTLLPGLFIAYTITAFSDPGVVRLKELPDPRTGGGGGGEALAGVAVDGMDVSSSGVDADGIVDEGTAAQRRAAQSAQVADISASYGFRQTELERRIATEGPSALRAGKGSDSDVARRRKRHAALRPGDPLPADHPDVPSRSEYCPDCDHCVRGMDHHCPWTGQCIAEGNVVAFYWFLALVFASLIFVMTSSMAHAIKLRGPGRLRLPGKVGGLAAHTASVPASAAASGVSAVQPEAVPVEGQTVTLPEADSTKPAAAAAAVGGGGGDLAASSV